MLSTAMKQTTFGRPIAKNKAPFFRMGPNYSTVVQPFRSGHVFRINIVLIGFAQHVTTAPDGLNVILAASR